MTTSIIIPCFNHYDLLHQLLWDLYKTNKDDIDEVVIVDDASTDEGFQDGIEGFWFKQKLLPIKVLTLQTNSGFLKASNAGVKFSSGDVVFLISTDVRIRENFIVQARGILSDFPNFEVGGRLITFDTGWNTLNGNLFPYLEGWLIGCTKELWKLVGGFDERFSPNDYEDIDFSTSVLRMGGDLAELIVDVEHIGAQTLGYNPAREAITVRNKELFRSKWIG